MAASKRGILSTLIIYTYIYIYIYIYIDIDLYMYIYIDAKMLHITDHVHLLQGPEGCPDLIGSPITPVYTNPLVVPLFGLS